MKETQPKKSIESICPAGADENGYCKRCDKPKSIGDVISKYSFLLEGGSKGNIAKEFGKDLTSLVQQSKEEARREMKFEVLQLLHNRYFTPKLTKKDYANLLKNSTNTPKTP